MNISKLKMKLFQVRLTLGAELVNYSINQLTQPHISKISKLYFTFATGQCTVLLADYFKNVYGFDVAESQINQAKIDNKHSNVSYMVSFSITKFSLDVNLVYVGLASRTYPLAK